MDKKWKIGLLILSLYLIAGMAQISAEPDTDYSDTVTLAYNNYFYVYQTSEYGRDYRLEWSFSGGNSYVGITVKVMNQANFANFQNGDSYYAEELSDGSYYSASGEYLIPYSDYWYVVFLNWDSDQQSTDLSVTVNTLPLGSIEAEAWSSSSYEVDDDIEIRWTATESATNNQVKIELFDNNNELYTTVTSGTENDGSYIWTIPDWISTDEYYRFKITSLTYPDRVYDYSSSFFLVSGIIPSTENSENTETTDSDGDSDAFVWLLILGTATILGIAYYRRSSRKEIEPVSNDQYPIYQPLSTDPEPVEVEHPSTSAREVGLAPKTVPPSTSAVIPPIPLKPDSDDSSSHQAHPFHDPSARFYPDEQIVKHEQLFIGRNQNHPISNNPMREYGGAPPVTFGDLLLTDYRLIFLFDDTTVSEEERKLGVRKAVGKGIVLGIISGILNVLTLGLYDYFTKAKETKDKFTRPDKRDYTLQQDLQSQYSFVVPLQNLHSYYLAENSMGNWLKTTRPFNEVYLLIKADDGYGNQMTWCIYSNRIPDQKFVNLGKWVEKLTQHSRIVRANSPDDFNVDDIEVSSQVTSELSSEQITEQDLYECYKCGIQNSGVNKFCTSCGAKLTKNLQSNSPKTKICVTCGTENNNASAFCTECGNKLS